MKHLLKIISGIVVISILFLFTGCEKKDTIVGKINGEEVKISLFNSFLESAKSQLLLDSGFHVNDPEVGGKITEFWNVKSNRDQVRKKAFEDLVKFKVHYKDLTKIGFKLSKEDEDSFEYKFNEQYEKNINFKSQLKVNTGLELSEFKKLTYDLLMVKKYEEQEAKKIDITDSEIKELYEKEKEKYDYVSVRQIYFNIANSEKEKEEITKKSEDLIAKIKAGDDMATLAKKYSEDPGVVDNMGEYKVRKDGRMVPEFEEWAMKAKVGDIEMITSTYGFHIVKCEKYSTFDDVKDDVKFVIQKKKYIKLSENVLSDKSNKIEKYQDEIDKIEIK